MDCNQSPSEHIDVCKLVEIMHINYLEVNLVEAVKPALTVQVEFLGRKVAMEVDTGSKISLMNEKQFRAWFPQININKSDVKLRTLSAPIEVIGSVSVQVFDKSKQVHDLDLIICSTQGPIIPLLGRDWLDKLSPDWKLAVTGNMYQSVNTTKEMKGVQTPSVPPEIQELIQRLSLIHI